MTMNDDYVFRTAPRVLANDGAQTSTAEALEMLTAIAASDLLISGKRHPMWTYCNVYTDVVFVEFATSHPTTTRVRVTWKPNEEHRIPAFFASTIHKVVSVNGGDPICMGGSAPVQLVRIDPKQNYEIHPSLFSHRDARAVEYAVTSREKKEMPNE